MKQINTLISLYWKFILIETINKGFSYLAHTKNLVLFIHDIFFPSLTIVVKDSKV